MTHTKRQSVFILFIVAFILSTNSIALCQLMTSPAWTAEGNQDECWFGVSVGNAGDVNGDGFSDVIVGSYLYDNGQNDEGRAFVYYGSASGLATSPAWTAESNQADAWFGYSVGTAGDVNADGFSDVIVGAWHASNGQSDEGRAFVYYGSAGGLSTSPDWSGDGNQIGAHFGISVSTAGDVNDDGFSDVIVGAWHYSNVENHEGRVFVYHGSAEGLNTTAAWTAEVNQPDAYLGISVGTAGDVNGDGFSDVIAGAYGYDNGESQEGRAFVYHGSVAGLASMPAWNVESNHIAAYMGNWVGTAGDVNSDGFSEVIVSAYQYNNGQAAEGIASVYHGSAAGLAVSPAWTVEGNQIGAHFGVSAGTAGDVNDDGFSDVIVGAFLYNNGAGQAFVYDGSPAGLDLTPSWTGGNTNGGGQFGFSSGTAGDVNGDGVSDVIVGAWEFSDEEFEEGRALVYLGSAEATSVGSLSIEEQNLLLEDGVPNPFSEETELSYMLPQAGWIRLSIYDLSGRHMTLLAEGAHEAGRHTVHWNARNHRGQKLSPGVYFARLEYLDRVATRKIVLTR